MVGRKRASMMDGQTEQRTDTLGTVSTVLSSLAKFSHAQTRADLKQAMVRLLEELGKYAKADRAYVFELAHDPERFVNTFEWCADGVAPQIQQLQNLTVQEDMPVWTRQFTQRGSVFWEDIDQHRTDAPKEYAILKPQNIHSVMALPIYHAAELVGFVGLDNPRIRWSEGLINLLDVVGGHLGSVDLNYQTEEKLSEKKRELERERMFLESLCREYTSVYYVNLVTQTGEVIKVDDRANAITIVGKSGEGLHYFPVLELYAKRCVLDPEAFLDRMKPEVLRRSLEKTGRSSFRYESVPNAAGHRHFEAQIVLLRDAPEEFGVMIGFRYIDDIIAQERLHQQALEQALEEARQSNSIVSAISKIYFAIFRIDLERNYYEEVSADQEIHHVTGERGVASEKMRELCENFVTPEYQKAVSRFFDLSTLAERMQSDDTLAIEYLAKDGNWHLARFIDKKRDAAGRVVQVLYVTRLISDTKRREQNLIVQAEEANRANQAKTEFLSQIAHDIRTPMNVICGFTDVIRANLEDREKVLHGLNQIDSASHYLQQIVDDVLDLTWVEKGDAHVNLGVMSVQEIFQQFQESIGKMMPGKRLEVQCRREHILHDHLLADSLRLRQIYTNLLSNAVKYTPEGGRVEFTLSEQEGSTPDRVKLIAVVSDTGIGMTKEYMKKMYDRFSRAVDTRIDGIRGTGLGLAVVKELVSLMGGTIQADSTVGKGTTFRVEIELTCAKSAAVTEKAPERQAAELCRGMHLLVAEDNDLNYEIAQELLGMHGVTCERAENGQVCVDKFRTAPPGNYQAILMDMQMPVMDGLEAARQIRALAVPEAKTIPIIALTANAFRDDVKACMEAGMNCHMPKPFDVNKLLDTVARLTGKTD